jgi:hypothetical protein
MDNHKESIATDADRYPTVIYVGIEVDDEGVERILFTGHVNMSVSPPTFNIYGSWPKLT